MQRVIFLVITAALLAAAPSARAEGLSLQPPVPGEVVQPFDEGHSRYGPGHRGVDLEAPEGAAVHAAADGIVTFTGSVAGRPSVSITHEDGRRTTYTPVAGSVSVGEEVQSGQAIGTVTGPAHCRRSCLHWGLTDGTDYFDPWSLTRDGSPPQVRLLPEGTRPPPPPPQSGPTHAGPGSLPVAGRLSSPFGMRTHPVTGVHKLHDGTDIAAPCGTPIQAWGRGTVVRAEWHRAYGYRVWIDHGDIRTAYTHMPGLDVTVGQVVAAGQPIGRVGTTGLSTGCHLHWMAWRGGDLVDPLTLP